MSNLKTLPKVIKCGAFDIGVITVENLNHKGTEAYGLWVSSEQAICLDTCLEGSALLLPVLIHEINHALYWFFSLEDTAPEERVVSCLATGWATIYRDNPGLLKWLQRNS